MKIDTKKMLKSDPLFNALVKLWAQVNDLPGDEDDPSPLTYGIIKETLEATTNLTEGNLRETSESIVTDVRRFRDALEKDYNEDGPIFLLARGEARLKPNEIKVVVKGGGVADVQFPRDLERNFPNGIAILVEDKDGEQVGDGTSRERWVPGVNGQGNFVVEVEEPE